MKTQVLIFLSLFYFARAFAQQKLINVADSSALKLIAREKQFSVWEAAEYLAGQNEGKKYVSPPSNFQVAKFSNVSIIASLPCSNMDFESGNTSPWVQTNGFNPMANPAGCCFSNTLIDQAVVTGNATDPFGGFPVVFPGGNFSLRLGSTSYGGRADRIEQTFNVTTSNSILRVNYAPVLNDGGHAVYQQSRITFEIVDTLGNQIPCAFIADVATSNGNLITSLVTGANNSPVLYRNWSPIYFNLGSYIGQNLTFRATAYDCAPTGHFAYCYLDVACINSVSAAPVTTLQACNGSAMCSPVSGVTFSWTGPATSTTSCFTPTSSGVYSCVVTQGQGCPALTYVYSVNVTPFAQLNLNVSDTSSCLLFHNFTSTVAGAATSTLFFGDGSWTTSLSTNHSYAFSGSYPSKLVAVTATGCRDTLRQLIRIFNTPTASFSTANVCAGKSMTLVNQSFVVSDTITSNIWAVSGNTLNSVNAIVTPTSSGIKNVSLTVTSQHGCSATAVNTVMIYPQVQATINVSDTSSCQLTHTVSAILSLPATSLNTLWNFGDGSLTAQQSSIHTYSATGNYQCVFTAVSQDGCSDTLRQLVRIFPAPVAAFSGTSICAGNSHTLINLSSVAAGSIVSAIWAVPGSTVVSPNLLLQPLSTGVNNLTLTVISDHGCIASAVNTVYIHPAPQVAFTYTTDFCSGSSFSLNNTSTIESGSILSYSWSVNGSSLTSIPAPVFTLGASAPLTISLQAVSNAGCYGQSSITASVFPLPAVSVNSGTICEGNSFTFTPTGATQYSFSAGSNVITPVQTATYFVTGYNNFGCSAVAASTVIVYNQPTVSVAAGSICAGQTFSILPAGAQTYSITGGNYIVSPGSTTSYYVWGFSPQSCMSMTPAVVTLTVYPLPTVTIGGGTICAGSVFILQPAGAAQYSFSSGTASVYPLVSQSYTVLGYSTQSCEAQAIANVSVLPRPQLTLLQSKLSVCEFQPVTFSLSGASTYSWYNGSNTNTLQVNVQNGQNYFALGWNTAGCRDSVIALLNIMSNPTLSVSGPSVLCFGETGTLIASGAQTYYWDPAHTTSVYPFMAQQTTTYNVKGTNLIGCSSALIYTVEVDECTGLNEIITTDSFLIYPMPVDDQLSISSLLPDQAFKAEIYNELGQLLLSRESAGNDLAVNTAAWSKGIYYCRISGVNWHLYYRIVRI